MATRPFLTAEWHTLAMLNYAVDPALLANLVPRGTELDQFGRQTYVSLVGFRFERTRIRGLWIPFHSDFDEVNLRFYVRREQSGEVRRGVVFVREVVPRWAIAAVARAAYRERYVALAMRHRIAGPVSEGGRVQVDYGWRSAREWAGIHVEVGGKPARPAEGSLEQFITEHYWGYAAHPDGGCLEYEVKHPRWEIRTATFAKFAGDGARYYGSELGAALGNPPDSAFLIAGSTVTVFKGKRIA